MTIRERRFALRACGRLQQRACLRACVLARVVASRDGASDDVANVISVSRSVLRFARHARHVCHLGASVRWHRAARARAVRALRRPRLRGVGGCPRRAVRAGHHGAGLPGRLAAGVRRVRRAACSLEPCVAAVRQRSGSNRRSGARPGTDAAAPMQPRRRAAAPLRAWAARAGAAAARLRARAARTAPLSLGRHLHDSVSSLNLRCARRGTRLTHRGSRPYWPPAVTSASTRWALAPTPSCWPSARR